MYLLSDQTQSVCGTIEDSADIIERVFFVPRVERIAASADNSEIEVAKRIANCYALLSGRRVSH